MKAIFSTAVAIALAALAGQPVYADKKDNDKDRRTQTVAGSARNAPTARALASREAAAARESRPVVSQRSVGRSANLARTPSITRDSAVTRAPLNTTRSNIARSNLAPAATTPRTRVSESTFRAPTPAVVESRRSDTNRRVDIARRNDSRNWSNSDRFTSWQRYRYYQAPSFAFRDWDHNRSYSWNHHRYHWYDGAWVIIDPGYAYVGPSYDGTYYDTPAPIGANLVMEVQSELLRAGYDPGPADGLMGGRTRDAIARFQTDHGLAVTARIDRPLLVSLGLES